MKGKKPKVIPHCYRRNLSRTLSNSSVSQLVQIGSYKKRINDLSRNNRHLATALQGARIEAAMQNNFLKDFAKDCNNIMYAKIKLNKMAKYLAKFVSDLEEVRDYLELDILSKNAPFVHKKSSPNDKLCKEPPVNCIEEVSEEISSASEVFAAENVLVARDPSPPQKSDGKKSDILPSNLMGNAAVLNEVMDIAPILFTDDSEDKKKKSSCKSKSSEVSSDSNKGSLTPQLNIDLTSVKRKTNSLRRQTQFAYPGSRSTSRGKSTPVEKETSPEEVAFSEKPTSKRHSIQVHDRVAERRRFLDDLFKSPTFNNIKEKISNNSENQTELAQKECVSSDDAVKTPAEIVAAPEVQPMEPNHTVISCEDMELTEVIRPVHQIIVESAPPLADNVHDCDFNKEGGENDGVDVFAETKDNNKGVISKNDTEESTGTHSNTPQLPNLDDMPLPELNDADEIQNVGRLTFCEPADDDCFTASKASKASTVRCSRNIKPVKYAVFFSSDESDADSSFEILCTKPTSDKRKTLISIKPGNIKDTVGQHKATVEAEYQKVKKNPSECPGDAVTCEKKLEMKSSKNSKEVKISSKNDLTKHLKKSSTTSKDGSKADHATKLVPHKEKHKKATSVDENVKKTIPSDDNGKNAVSSHKNVKKTIFSDENLKNTISSNENVKKKISSNENVKNTIHSNEKVKKKISSDDNVKNTIPSHENVKKKISSNENGKNTVASHENVKKTIPNNENVKKTISNKENAKKTIPSHENAKKTIPNQENVSSFAHNPVFSPGILKKTQSNFQAPGETAKTISVNKVTNNNHLDDDLAGAAIDSPKSDFRRVSFASTDLVCNFKRMSLSKKIAENQKLRRTSKSILDFEELLKEETQTKSSNGDRDNFSESAKTQNVDMPSPYNFSGETELYTFHCPKNTDSSSVPVDDLARKNNVFPSTSQENLNKPSNKPLKKVAHDLKCVKITAKLALKKNKDPNIGKKGTKNTGSGLNPDEISKGKDLFFESPVSVYKATKRKSLFKEPTEDDTKENNFDPPITKKSKNVFQEKNKAHTTATSEVPTEKNESQKPKEHSKPPRKSSAKKKSDKLKLSEPNPETKKKKHSMAMKLFENSPVLKDTVNLPEVQDDGPRRRSKPISYREPSLNKKLRRE